MEKQSCSCLLTLFRLVSFCREQTTIEIADVLAGDDFQWILGFGDQLHVNVVSPSNRGYYLQVISWSFPFLTLVNELEDDAQRAELLCLDMHSSHECKTNQILVHILKPVMQSLLDEQCMRASCILIFLLVCQTRMQLAIGVSLRLVGIVLLLTHFTPYSLVGSLNKIPLSIAGIFIFKVPTSLENSASIFFGKFVL